MDLTDGIGSAEIRFAIEGGCVAPEFVSRAVVTGDTADTDDRSLLFRGAIIMTMGPPMAQAVITGIAGAWTVGDMATRITVVA